MARCLRCKAGNEWIEGDVKPESVTTTDIVLVCRSGVAKTFPFDDLAVTSDGMIWHDHSAEGGDIVCCGPFALFGSANTAFRRTDGNSA